MIRKHTRRAAKAAFAISLGVAIILGGATAATAGSSKKTATPIIVGTKNFGEAFVLGELYKQALEAKGFDVSYKENIGSTELIQKALTSGKITLYPEYLGIAYTVTFKKTKFPASANATYATVKRLYKGKGYTVLRMTPFQDVDAVAVLRTTAKKYGLKKVSDLKKVPDLTLAAFPEFKTRETGLVGMKKRYGVTDVKFTPLAGISAYKLLDDKKVLAAGVFSTDPPLATSKYVVLKDPKNIFGFQNVVPIVSNKLK
jgi:osmoprotectant transport system substrate-binding protein